MKTKILFTVMALFFATAIFAQSGTVTLSRFVKNGKVGFIDNFGNEVIPAKYDGAGSVYDDDAGYVVFEGLVWVKLKKKYGYINTKGEVIVPLKYNYVSSHFSGGLAIVRLEKKYGFIDKTGNIIVSPKYDRAFNFYCERARVILNGKYGFIDKTGKEVIPLKYDDAQIFFNDKIKVKLNGKEFLIDTLGNPPPVIEKSGTAGALKWTLTGNTFFDNTLTISGNGEMPNYTYTENAPWYSESTLIGKVVINKGVTSIGYFAFGWCSELSSVTIMNPNTYIDKNAFDGCDKLPSKPVTRQSSASSSSSGHTQSSQNERAKTKCSNCNGTGHTDCRYCYGNYEEAKCTTCSGAGEKKCVQCDGTGEKKCYGCLGTGYIDRRDRCVSCSGRGYTKCSSCSGNGSNKCTSCYGRGYKKCDFRECHQGKETCYKCKGAGYVE